MFKRIALAFVVILLSWSLYQRTQWEEDYSLYQAPILTFPPIDPTFQSHINTTRFDNALVISNTDLLSFPEDIAVSQDGTIYSGTIDGAVMKIDSNGNISVLHQNVQTGGVFGIILNEDETKLYYVTEFKGLVSLELANNKEQILFSVFEGKPLKALNNLCLDEQETTIYMTESTPFAIRHAGKDILLKHQKGRILFYSLITHQSGVFAQNLAYPNGIVYDKSTQSIIVSELSHYKISKISLESKQKSTLVDNLFGYPDNLELNSNGQLYVGIPAVRDQSVEYLNQQPQKRKWLMFVPQSLISLLLRRVAGGIKVDTKNGKIKQYIFGDSSVTYSVTTLLERNGLLYMSSLQCPTIVVIGQREKVVVSGEDLQSSTNSQQAQQL